MHEPEVTRRIVERWAAPLALWPEVGEESYRLCRLALADPGERAPDWPGLVAQLHELGLVRPGASDGRVVFRDGPRRTLLSALEAGPGARATKSLLIEAWLRGSDAQETATIAGWALELQQWTELGLIWVMASHRHSYPGILGVIPVFAGLPDDVRRDHPVLSLAAGIARGIAGKHWFTHPWAGREIGRDGILFHSRWRSHVCTDKAVIAGALWMLVQRQLPGASGEPALIRLAATKSAVLDRIRQANASEDPPGEYALQLFHVAAAETSVGLDDLTRGAAEADVATMLGDGPLQVLSGGLRAVCQELLGQPSTPRTSPLQPAGARPAPGRTPPLRYASVLARGMRGLAELDEDVTASVLAAVPDSPEIGAPYAVLRAWVEAMRGVLWGDSEVALAKLDWVQHTISASVLREPLTRRLFTSVRIQLLTQLGAVEQADAAIWALPAPEQWLHRSRVHLWSGDADQAASVATAGIYDAATPSADRQHLLAVKASSLLVDRHAEPRSRDAAIQASAGYSFRADNYLPVALLPTSVGLRLLEQFAAHPEWDPSGRSAAPLLRRFDGLARREGSGWPDIQLTSRESVLLPLLATSATIPEIAERLGVSVHTVRKQVATLRAKFGAPTRAELVHRADRAGVSAPTSATGSRTAGESTSARRENETAG